MSERVREGEKERKIEGPHARRGRDRKEIGERKLVVPGRKQA